VLQTRKTAFPHDVFHAISARPMWRRLFYSNPFKIMSEDNFKAKDISRKPPAPPDPNQKFWDIADTFIQLANENSKGATAGQVCAAMMYASARFGAFVASGDAPNESTFKGQVDNAVLYFRTEYEKMLRENFRDYAENFKSYHPEKK